jgi:acyl carrier protein
MSVTSSSPIGPQAGATPKDIEALIRRWFADNKLVLPEGSRDSFEDLGVDSIGTVELALFLASELRMEIDETIVYSYPTVEDLSRYLAAEAGRQDVDKS